MFAVVEVLAGITIIATQESLADTAGGAVIVGSMVQADLLFTGDGHDAFIEPPVMARV